MLSLTDEEVPYYKIGFWTQRWSHCEGCIPISVQGISLEKPPPPLPEPPDKKSTLQKEVINVPPFDIQEIPDAMRLEGMPISAKLMERWFAGILNYAPTDDDLSAEINQNGNPYPASMYDSSTIKMGWVLKFKRAEDRYDYLVNQAIRRQTTIQPLRAKLTPFRSMTARFDTWDLCKGSMSVLHRHFHFQYVPVGSSLSQKLDEFAESAFLRSGVPDDLTGALGSFNLYAAPADVKIDSVANEAIVSSVYVYVKDSFDFTDKPGTVSQYLGHWSSKGVIVVPYNALVGQLSVPSLYLPYPVARGDMRAKGNVFYPVHNSDFRQWAIKHQRGGDFVIFSDRKRCQLRTPLRIQL